MICPDCRGSHHGSCANLRRHGVSSFIGKYNSWCDCQHQPGTSPAAGAAPAKDDRPGAASGETSSAALHVPA